MDVKYFYLNNHMDRDECIMMKISMIPQEFVEKYNLTEKSHNGYIYARVKKGIYGIPQSVRIEHDVQVKQLETYIYHPSRNPPGLWKHNS